MPPPLTTLRQAVRGALLANPTLVAFLSPNGGGVPRLFYEPRREAVELPTITYVDFGARLEGVPLWDRTYQIDCWARTLSDAETMAALVIAQLQGGAAVATRALPDLRVAYFRLQVDRPEITEHAELVRRQLDFRCLAYSLTAA